MFLMVLLKPHKYGNLVPLLAWSSIFEGIVLLVHGLLAGISLFPFAGDVFFCLVVGCGLLLCSCRQTEVCLKASDAIFGGGFRRAAMCENSRRFVISGRFHFCDRI